jgi:hypothetical protein
MTSPFTVLQQSGVWIQDPHSISPEDLAARMAANRVRWVAPLIQEGLGQLNHSEYVGPPKWWDRLKAAATTRIVRLGWCNDTHGEGEDVKTFCAIASAQVDAYKLDGMIFDLEKSWENEWERWDAFLKEWRRLRPGLLTVLSSYAFPPYVAFPWKNIAAAKVRYAPQNLYRYAEFYRCRYSLQGAAEAGYPKSYVHFMLSREEGHSLLEGVHDAEAARREFRGQGQGISFYLAETGSPEEQDAAWALMAYAAQSGLSGWNP